MKPDAPVELIITGLMLVVLGVVSARYYDRIWGPLLDGLAAFKLRRREDHRVTDLVSRRIVPGVFDGGSACRARRLVERRAGGWELRPAFWPRADVWSRSSSMGCQWV